MVPGTNRQSAPYTTHIVYRRTTSHYLVLPVEPYITVSTKGSVGMFVTMTYACLLYGLEYFYIGYLLIPQSWLNLLGYRLSLKNALIELEEKSQSKSPRQQRIFFIVILQVLPNIHISLF